MPESPYKWTPRERSVRDQNMAHARETFNTLVANTRAWIADGVRDEELEDKMIDQIFDEAHPSLWPGKNITQDVAVVALLLTAMTVAAEQPCCR